MPRTGGVLQSIRPSRTFNQARFRNTSESESGLPGPKEKDAHSLTPAGKIDFLNALKKTSGMVYHDQATKGRVSAIGGRVAEAGCRRGESGGTSKAPSRKDGVA